MKNKELFLFASFLLLLALVLVIFDMRILVIACVLFAAIDFSFILWAREENRTGIILWVDIILVWLGALVIIVFDNWGGLTGFVLPGLTLAQEFFQNPKKNRGDLAGC